MLKWWTLLTSFKGRMSRSDYNLGSIVLTALLVGAVSLIYLTWMPHIQVRDGVVMIGAAQRPHLAFAGLLGGGVLGAFTLWSSIALCTKRLHDRNKSGLWNVLFLLPILPAWWWAAKSGYPEMFVGEPSRSLTYIALAAGVVGTAAIVWFTVELSFFRGASSENRFGQIAAIRKESH